MRLCLPHRKVFLQIFLFYHWFHCYFIVSAPFRAQDPGPQCIQFIHITPLAFVVYIYFSNEPVCAMFLLLLIVTINLCKRLSKNIDEGIQTNLISIEEFPLFPRAFNLRAHFELYRHFHVQIALSNFELLFFLISR